MSIAYAGTAGALAHVAAQKFAQRHSDTSGSEFLPLSSFSEVCAAVASGKAVLGVVPVENSTSGTLHAVLDAVLSAGLGAVSEICVQVRAATTTAPLLLLRR